MCVVVCVCVLLFMCVCVGSCAVRAINQSNHIRLTCFFVWLCVSIDVLRLLMCACVSIYIYIYIYIFLQDRVLFAQLTNQITSDQLGQVVDMIQADCPGE